jgi:Succinylglutamate desuccinylase / Aspartoacylase family
MTLVKFNALDRSVEVEREIGRYGNSVNGPTIVVFAGIHGNEPSGIFALKEVFSDLEKLNPRFEGLLIALAGNKPALESGKRYINHDLNRIWQAEQIDKIKDNGGDDNEIRPDIEQQIELYAYIENIFKQYKPPYYFIDLHTTSSQSVPFITINDTIRNRNFALHFPVPVILGIEEFLPGTMLSYINELGPVAIGFEAGHHEELSSIENHISCLWISLANTGCMSKNDIPHYQQHFDKLKNQSADSNKVFEIRFRHERKGTEDFVMDPGYQNFQHIKKNQHLAKNKFGDLFASENGRIFLPLYQKLGDDGFFIIREIKRFWLKVSAKLRFNNAERFIKYLPGIQQDKKDPHTFRVHVKIGRWLIKDFFHLLGFRRSVRSGKYQMFVRRKFDVTTPQMYNKKTY